MGALKVRILPCVGLAGLELLRLETGLAVAVEDSGALYLVRDEPAPGLDPETVFQCDRCDWFGQHPRFTDTRDTYAPPRGEIPCCPACGSYCVTLKLTEDLNR